MAKASFSLKTLKLTKTSAIDSAIRAILSKAAEIYVLEAYKHVPVDTGMSRGALVPLASIPGIAVPDLHSKRSLPGKSIQAGAEKSYANLYKTGNIHILEWSTSVFQYYLNELYPLRSNYNAPWNSLKQGSLKVKQYLRSTRPEVARAIKRSWSRVERNR